MTSQEMKRMEEEVKAILGKAIADLMSLSEKAVPKETEKQDDQGLRPNPVAVAKFCTSWGLTINDLEDYLGVKEKNWTGKEKQALANLRLDLQGGKTTAAQIHAEGVKKHVP